MADRQVLRVEVPRSRMLQEQPPGQAVSTTDQLDLPGEALAGGQGVTAPG